MKSVKMIFLLIATLAFSVSCIAEKSNSEAKKSSDELNINTDDINSTITLEDTAEMANTHINGELLTLRLTNHSKEVIHFNGDYDLKLLNQENGIWVNVSNAFYYPDDPVKLSPVEQDPVGLLVDSSPYIKTLTGSKIIRIVVSGTIDSKNTLVAAYLDVLISP